MQKSNVTTISQNWCKSQTETQMASVYKALSGDWGVSGGNGDTRVAYVGHLVIWSKTGSGAGDAEIPESKSRYFAQLKTDSGTSNIWVEANQSHIEVAVDSGARWELSGLFIVQ